MNSKLRLSTIAVGFVLIAGLLHFCGAFEGASSPDTALAPASVEPGQRPRTNRRRDEPAWTESFADLAKRAERAQAEAAENALNAHENLARLHGQVFGPDGKAVSARVFLLRGGEVLGAVLADRTTEADGRFQLAVPYSFDDATTEAIIGAVADGMLRHTQAVTLTPTSDAAVDLHLQAGMSLRGRIVTEDGAPVPNLRVYVACGNLPRGMVSGHTFAKDGQLLAPTSNGYHEARLVTDARGEFTAKGLGKGLYAVFSMDPAWFVSHSRRHEPGASETTEWIAHRALTVVGSVQSKATGEPVPEFEFSAKIQSSERPNYNLSGRCLDGKLYVSWKPQFEESEHGCRVMVKIEADGYHPAEASREFRAGSATTEMTFALERRETSGITLNVVGPSGSPVDFPLNADAVDRYDQSVRISPVTVRAVGPGRYEMELPAGQWFVRVHSTAPHGRNVKWDGEVGVSTTGESSAWCSLSEFGTLRVALPTPSEEAQETVWLRVGSRDGKSTGLYEFRRGQLELKGFPVGEWVASVVGSRREVEFSIRADEATSIELSP